MSDSTPVDPKLLKLAATALFAEQLSQLTMHSLHGGSDTIKSTAKLMRGALDKREDELLAEVMEGAK